MKRQIAISAAALLAASAVAFAQGTQPPPGGAPAQSAPPAGGTVTPGPGGTPPAGIPEKMEREPIGKAAPKAGQKSATDRPAKDGKAAAGKDMKDDKGGKDARQTPPASSGKAAKETKTGKDGKEAASKDSKKDGGGAAAAAPEDKKPQLRAAFQKHRVKPAQDINVSINVGVAIPRTVVLYAVPQDVVVVYPGYRRYKYFLIGDRICIVDPATFMIIDIIVLAA